MLFERAGLCPALTVKLGPMSPHQGPFVLKRPKLNSYRVIDLIAPGQPEFEVKANSPELAARDALGEEVVRSGAKRDLRAKVYFQHPEQPVSMVRLYSKVEIKSALEN